MAGDCDVAEKRDVFEKGEVRRECDVTGKGSGRVKRDVT